MFKFGAIEPDWKGQMAYVIGGGPSLSGFDFTRLKGLGKTIGANKSAWFADTDVLFSLDQHFMRMCREDIVAYIKRGGEAILAVPPNEDSHKQIDGATYVIRRRNGGMSSDPTSIYGVNSGYGALGVAFLRGAAEIALLGLDMGYGGASKTHFHEGYSWHNRNGHRFMNRWSTDFERAKIQIEGAGAHVTNFIGEPLSKIECFDTRPLADLT